LPFGAFIPAGRGRASIITAKNFYSPYVPGAIVYFFERKITDVTATASNDRQIRVRKKYVFVCFVFKNPGVHGYIF